METEVKVDVQSQKILSGIKSTLDLLRNELIENILELSSNVESKQYWNLLKRLERSLDQYIKRDRKLIYIGFLGHYSSGKSSTINSLLNLEGTKDERPVNINPTDDQITLITDVNNDDQVIGLSRVGQVPVVINTVENIEFLRDKIILDTPGSGDPSLFEEIVRDSLPMCDLIVYCISATNPLDNSDIPLIQEKEKNLRDLPTIYVITRGNEFRVDEFKPLTDENFDEKKAKKDVIQIASRMKNIFESVDLDYDDFTIIDNKQKYNIDKLSKKIKSLTNKDNQQNLIQLHSHKVDFFQRTTRKIKGYFVDVIENKLATVESFFSQAERNIADYDKKTLISSDKLINEWRSVDDSIKSILEGSINENNRIHSSLDTPVELVDGHSISIWKDEYFSELKIANRRRAEETKSSFNSKIYDLKEQFKEEVRSKIEDGNRIKKEGIQNTLNEWLEEQFHVSVSLKIEYLNEYERFYDIANRFLSSERYEVLKTIHSSLQTRLRKTRPIDKIDVHIADSEKILNEIFSIFHEAVKVYKIAAFSAEAKKYIKNLGLSDKLDSLDSEPIDTSEYLQKVKSQLYGEISDELVLFKDSCDKLYSRLSELKVNPPIFSDHNNNDFIKTLEENSQEQASQHIVEFIDNKKMEIKEYLLEKVDEINTYNFKEEEEKQNMLNKLRKDRFKYYLAWLTPALGLLVLTFITVFYLIPKYELIGEEISVGNQWLVGILSNIGFASLNAFLVRKRDRYPMRYDETENEFKEKQRKSAIHLIDEGFYNFRERISQELSDSIFNYLQQLNKSDLDTLLSKAKNNTLYQFHKMVVDSEFEVKNCITEYSNSLTQLRNVIARTLNNVNKNKEVLTEQSIDIKKNSISPSFELLSSTKEEITQAQQLMKGISFS